MTATDGVIFVSAAVNGVAAVSGDGVLNHERRWHIHQRGR